MSLGQLVFTLGLLSGIVATPALSAAPDRVERASGAASPHADTLARTDALLLGDLLFHTPHVLGTRAQALGLSCASCHPGGLASHSFFIAGLSDKPGNIDLKTPFFHGGPAVGAENPINIPSLRGVAHTAPYGRDGRIGVLRVFIENVIVTEFSGKPLPLAQLRALTAYVESLDFLPNRLIDREGHLSPDAAPAAKRGAAVFRTPFPGLDNHSCAACHRPSSYFTDGIVHHRAEAADAPVRLFKTPTLLNSVETAPYFHDGRFAQLADVVAWYDHRFELGLSPASKADLTAYLAAVGAVDATPQPETVAQQLARATHYLTLLEGGTTANDRKLWQWTVELLGTALGAVPSNGAEAPRARAIAARVGALAATLQQNSPLDELRPQLGPLRQDLSILAATPALSASTPTR